MAPACLRHTPQQFQYQHYLLHISQKKERYGTEPTCLMLTVLDLLQQSRVAEKLVRSGLNWANYSREYLILYCVLSVNNHDEGITSVKRTQCSLGVRFGSLGTCHAHKLMRQTGD